MRTVPAAEHAFYSEVASNRAAALANLERIEDILTIECSQSFKYLVKAAQATVRTFPVPRQLWIESRYDCLAQWEAYNYLAPLTCKRVLQLGGAGVAAVQFMLGGAAEAWLLTPVADEARWAAELARLAGVELHCKVGVAEEIPFDDNFFDAIYAGGCAHHFETESAFPEIARVLKPGGRFSAVDPWRAPFYALGIKIFGKREGNGQVQCRPLTKARVAPLAVFGSHRVNIHGSFLRYPLLAANRVGLQISDNTAWSLARLDDWLGNLLHARQWGSSVALLAEK